MIKFSEELLMKFKCLLFKWLLYCFLFYRVLVFQGCAQRTHFQNEGGRLIVLKDEVQAFLALNRTGDCKVSSSRYINCRGNKVATMALPETFNIEWNPGRLAYGIEVSENSVWCYLNLNKSLSLFEVHCTIFCSLIYNLLAFQRHQNLQKTKPHLIYERVRRRVVLFLI